MATVTLSLLGAIAPEYSAMDETRLGLLNQIARIHVSDSVFGDHAEIATAYVIAHLAKLGDTSGAGAIKSESVGDISRSYAVPAGSGYWGLTSYGQQFSNLCNLIALPQGDLCIPPATFYSEE